MSQLLKLKALPLEMTAFYAQARDYRALPWPGDDEIHLMGRGENILTFADAFSAVRRNYKPYVALTTDVMVNAPFEYNDPEGLPGPVTFIPVDPTERIPQISSPIANVTRWLNEWNQREFFLFRGWPVTVGFLGLHFINMPHMRFWYGQTVVFSHCFIERCFNDWVYGGKGPVGPNVVVENCYIDTIHNWTRDYGQGLEPKRGGSGPAYVSMDGGNESQLFLFLRNNVGHVSGGVHVSAENGGRVKTVAINDNLFYNAAILSSFQGQAERPMVWRNAFLLGSNSIDLMKNQIGNCWDVSGGSTFLSWETEGGSYEYNYVGVAVPNWRVLWMSHSSQERLQSNIGRFNRIECAEGAYAHYGVGPSGGSVLGTRRLLRDGVEFFTPQNEIGKLKSSIPMWDREQIAMYLEARAGESGPDMTTLGPVQHWPTGGGVEPPPVPDEQYSLEDVKEQLDRIEAKVDELPDAVVSRLAAKLNR